ncbi:Testis-specific Y-encoded protein 1 [Heterocephalus glaber]|uniref:Testis-specific Y-encoded protein 1 n=1 Tax=Heterocephalus glaber TaxID=10181 RepID=G5BIJ2_HETGA|nr:Testis-specific Y-encoded protein 1 [Heterocephalus glaber]
METLLGSRSGRVTGGPARLESPFRAEAEEQPDQISPDILQSAFTTTCLDFTVQSGWPYEVQILVEEQGPPSNCCKISLLFRNNPYFQHEVIVKEFLWHITGYRSSRSTVIQWCAGYKCRAHSCRQNNSSPNLFNWFTGHSCAGCHRITQIIAEDLWLSHLLYYKSKKPPEEGAGHTGEQVRT